MSALRIKLLKLSLLNLIFLNILARDLPKVTPPLGILSSQNGVSKDAQPKIVPITSAEIQAQSVLLASDINRDWWLKAGIYTSAGVIAGCLLYRNRERIFGGAAKLSDAGFSNIECEKIRQLLLQAEQTKTEANNGFLAQAKNDATRMVGIAIVGGVVIEPVLTPVLKPVAQKVILPAVKFMGTRNLSYYLYQTKLHEQILSLKNFVQSVGDYQIDVDSGEVIDLKSAICQKLIDLRIAMVTVLAYLEYAQNDLATGIEVAQASMVQQQLLKLRGMALSVQQTCNKLLINVQNALGQLKSQADQQLLANQIYQLQVHLSNQFTEFEKAI